MIQNDPVAITQNTYQAIHQSYTANNIVLNEDIKLSLDKFISLVGKNKSILDIGCANGRESKYLSDNGYKVTGIDLLDEFVQTARKNCPQCSFEVGDMRNLQFDKNSFDGLWVSASFLHVPKCDAQATLTGFHNILKKHGILYISVMEGDYDAMRENTVMKWGMRHFSDYKKEELEVVFDKTGFKIITMREVKTHWGVTFLHYFCQKK